jgi:hypothetical protein
LEEKLGGAHADIVVGGIIQEFGQDEGVEF